jgi:predicted alpha/beta-hydrolase family hydrolase
MIERINAPGINAPGIDGFLHPADSPVLALVYAHGAGGDANAKLLVRIAAELAESRVTVLRMNLPFRQARPAGPPRPTDAAADQQGIAHALAWLSARTGLPVAAAGHSYGGRQASMLLAAKPDAARALVLTSYPLHPPGKPQQLRTAHLATLTTPTLFIQGERDPFGTPAELAPYLPPNARIHAVEKSGHDLRTFASAEPIRQFLESVLRR